MHPPRLGTSGLKHYASKCFCRRDNERQQKTSGSLDSETDELRLLREECERLGREFMAGEEDGGDDEEGGNKGDDDDEEEEDGGTSGKNSSMSLGLEASRFCHRPKFKSNSLNRKFKK